MLNWPFCRRFKNIICFYLLNNMYALFLFLFFHWLLKPTMWWDPKKRFCVSCGCSPMGSVTPWCDITGRCVCKSGFVGKRCSLSRQVHRQEEQPQKAQWVLGSPQRWGASSSSGCPRGAYRPAALVIWAVLHGSCLSMLCSVCCCWPVLVPFYQIMVAKCVNCKCENLAIPDWSLTFKK